MGAPQFSRTVARERSARSPITLKSSWSAMTFERDSSTLPRPIGLAVVGAGYWGPNLIRNFSSSPHYRLIWVCDTDKSRAVKVLGSYSTVGTTDDLNVVLADERVDAVAIATPAGTHLNLALAAMRAGKHVLVEKPLAATYADGLRLVEEADRAGRVLMCDHTFCYTPAVRKIRELVQSGEIGDLHFFDSVRINLGLVQPDIDVVWDLAPHDISILESILPAGIEPLSVATNGADPIGTGRSCVAFVTLQLTGGAIAHFHLNWLSPTKVRTTMIGGSKRALLWDDLNPLQRVTVYDRGIDLLPAQEAGAEDRQQAFVSYRTGDLVSPALSDREALASVVEEFADCIRTGRRPLTDGRSGLRVLDILEAASRSITLQGAPVPLRGVPENQGAAPDRGLAGLGSGI
jgi:predicted dehydrogenase